VFASLLVAFSFAPTLTRFSENHKLAVFLGSTYLSMCLLFIVCCAMTHQVWWSIASSAVLLGYAVLFLPAILKRYIPEKGRIFIVPLYFVSLLALLLLLLLVIRITVPFPLGIAVKIALYCFLPLLILSAVHLLSISRLLKAAIDVLSFGVIYYGIEAVIARLLGEGAEQYYKVDFSDWVNCINGNISALYLILSVSVTVLLVVLYFVRKRRG